LSRKIKLTLKFFTVLKLLYTFRIFEHLFHALKNRVSPGFTVLNIYILSFRILEQLALALKTVCRRPPSYAYGS